MCFRLKILQMSSFHCYYTFAGNCWSQIQLFRAHHTILIIGTFDTLTGVMDYSIEEAQIAQAMILG